MSSQTFPPQGVGGTTTSNTTSGVTAAMTVKATAITKVTNNGKDMIRMDGSGGARTQLLADKQEGPRVVVQPAYPPMSMPKHFSPSPPSATVMQQQAAGKVMTTSLKVTATAPNSISTSTGSGIKTACYIIPATKGPQAADIAKATMINKVTAKQHIPLPRSLLTKTQAPVTTTMQPATQKIMAPVRIPMATSNTTSAGGDLHHPKTMVAGVVTTTPSAAHIKTTIHGLPAGSQATTGVQLPQGVLASMPFMKGVHQSMQSPVTFASHLPKGAAVAAAMTAPRAGMTTALRATVPIGGSQMASTPPTIIPPSILHTQMQQRLPSQVHLSAQVHMPNRVHSPAATAVSAATGMTVIPRVPSPAVSLTTHTPAEPHRTATHSAALQSLAVSAAQARSAEVIPHTIRSDPKHDAKFTEANLKVDSRAEVRTGTRPEIRHQGGRVEVRTGDPNKSDRTVGKLDPRTDIRSAYTYQLNALNAQKQHPYMASLNVPRQQMQGINSTLAPGVGTPTHTMIHSVPGATSVSSSAVTTQSTITAVVRTTSVTSTTMSSSHPQSSSNIPVAKVYPRQQHTTRMTTEQSPTAVYLPPHRNAQNVAVTSVAAGLPTSVSMSGSDHARTDRVQHPAGMPPGHYPAVPSYYFSPDLAPYHNMLRYSQHGPLATMPNTMVRPTIDSHTRLPVHPTTANQNSSVAAAVAAAAAAVGNTAPVRLSHHSPLTMMIEPRGRQVPAAMQNHVTATTADGPGSAVASALFLTSMAGGVYNTSQTTLNSMAVAASQQQQQHQQQQTTMSNPAASPRPSILQRKRATDSNAIRKATIPTSNSQPSSPGPKIDLSRAATHSPKATDSLSSSQHSVDSNMSEISTDTVPTPSSAGSLRIKQEPDVPSSTHGIEAGPQVTISTTGESGLNSTHGGHAVAEEVGPSPRKKPRKQQHIVATEHPDILDDQSTDEETETKPRPPFRLKKERKERKHHHRHPDPENMKIVHYFRRPCCRLLDTYRQTWKPTHNHFDRYTDVKPKEEKKISIHEIANQRGVLKKTDGWKIRHISYQFEDLGNLEKDAHDQMDELKDGLAEYQAQQDNKDTTQIYELMQGNIQRSKYVMEHLDEAKTTMLKLLEHKPKVLNIIKKHANKRHAKKKSHSS